MNGVRSISMRKGYWLTALAAAVLLAASSGTAYAQSVGFSKSSLTVTELASTEDDTPAPQIVDIVISGLTSPSEGPPVVAGNLATGLGTLTLAHEADLQGTTAQNRRVWLIYEGSTALDEDEHPDNDGEDDGKLGLENTNDTGLDLKYDKNGIIRLAIIDPAGDQNWGDDSFTMTVDADARGVSNSAPSVKVTLADVNAAPVVKFTPASIKLTERSQTTTTVTVAAGDDKPIPTDINDITGALRLMVSDSDMVEIGITCALGRAADPARAKPIHITGGGVPGGGVDAMGMTKDTFELDGSNVGGTDIQDPGVTLTIEACDETMDFRNAMATLTAVESSLKLAMGGPGTINAGAGLSIYVESDEDVPVVEFSTDEQPVDEGDSTSVFLVASTMQGDEVGMANVMVTGDARISLFGDNVEAAAAGGGAYTVSFGDSANTRLMIRADGDATLNDGEMKTATITITSANGATVGNDDTLIVTVRGSTSVAALPLLGQLLLALFLMAGGARLYRRRQG